MLTDLKSNLASFRKPFRTDTLIDSAKPVPKPMATTPAKTITEVNKTSVNAPVNYASNLDSINTIVESNLVVPSIDIIKSDLVITRTGVDLKNILSTDINYTVPTLKVLTNPTGNIRTKVLSINKLIQNIAFTTPIIQNNQTSVIKFTRPIIQNNQTLVIKFTTPTIQNNQSVITIRTPKLVNNTSPTNNISIKDIAITKFDQKKLETGYTKQSPNIFISKFDTESIETYSGISIFTRPFVDKSKYNLDKATIYTQATKFTKAKVNTSKFNIDSIPSKFSPGKYTPTKLYPENILKNTSTRWKGSVPPAVNFILDTAAKGFTVKYDSSKFVGINGETYTYPIKGKSVLKVGNYSLENQLGTGSPKVKSLGFTSTKKYEDAVKNTAQGSILGTWAITRRSPSPIDDQYTKFKIQQEAWNPTYISQPYVIRGIQNGLEPQLWGGSSFDDGLVRGGAATAAERVLFDTIRLGKFAASPKGLLWITKQNVLGLTRPNSSGINKIQTGLKSLLSAAGGVTGVRFPAAGGQTLLTYSQIKTSEQLLFNNRTGFGNQLTMLKFKLANGSLIISNEWGGPNSLYGIGNTKISRVVDTKQNAILVAKQNYSNLLPTDRFPKYNIFYKYLSGFIPALFNNTKSSDIESLGSVYQVDEKGLRTKMSPIFDPGYANTNDWLNLKGSSADVAQWNTTSYGQIPKKSKRKSNVALDFRKLREGVDAEDPNAQYQKSLEKTYGFGSLNANSTQVPVTGKGSFITSLADLRNNKHALANNPNFTGDKINAIDIGSTGDIYDRAKDLIDFYFIGEAKNEVMVFRATLTGFSDDFEPGWNNINIMGRPDGSYIYTSFERNISFSFRVAALSRSEMIPMWRKLNYLATYTMPDFSTARASGPMMRITIGNLFQKTPGFLGSLNISIPDDATWDIAEDADDNNLAKQLPMVVDVNVSYTVISDYRPQLHGRAYSLSKGGANNKDVDGNWLFDSLDKVKVGKAPKEPVKKTGG
jgi:hypothetical protein